MAVWVIREPGNGIALRFEAPLAVEGRERISNVLQQANDPCDGIDLISPTRKELIGEDVIALKALDQDLRFHLFLFAYHLLSMSSPTSVSLSGGKICFNSHCNEVIPDHTPPRKKGGWRLRSGEIAELCDRCSCVFRLLSLSLSLLLFFSFCKSSFLLLRKGSFPQPLVKMCPGVFSFPYSCAFEQGSFCETFHSDVAGWRNCEACGKMLSASDAGRIGRLVLPKKCAEVTS
ncbi:hypothetical protein BHE74_00030510 [Ensete ventricosum]|nr:hypothetical protein GW17_00023928 [Ensete ventricosum]RWW62359.1 hypothetical protein BHE74_00030510 [Ensete ventricosum]